MTFPDMRSPFIVKPDASQVSIGGVLMQVRDGKERVVAYASKALLGAEPKYRVYEKEALATVYCCQQWRHYLLGSVVFIQTDHKPNLAIEKNKLANERVRKWAWALQEYIPKFFYKDGKAHADADSLLRMPLPAEHSVDTGAPFCRHCNVLIDRSIPIYSSLEASIVGVESILRVMPIPEGMRAPPVCYDEYAGFIRQQRIKRVDRARGRAEREKQAREHKNPPQMTEKFHLEDCILLQKPTPNLGKQPKFVTKFEEGQTFVVVAVPHDQPHIAVIRPLGGKERDAISTDRLMLWQPAKRVEKETEERASAVEKERGEKIPPGTPKSSFRVGEDPDKDDFLDELGLGDELEVEKEQVKENSAGNKKRGKPQPTYILAVREKEGTEEYRVSFDNGTFAWMPEEEVEAPDLVRDFEKERERVIHQVN
uniref:Reverse transcriptase RNase H-like domain-containing protein n=1 Tax=Chromera velia CCMP2878 TaxID=1169474 RepID=A0A0G4FI35_9ALVE|eukprot:Cvel_17066.t1-p1 / transcript=Cvel_17066.t1 / gene=Cvel_17066 / organism=Chromera_velia_CCMP2878 / gene_product=Retrovirus-related Pol polyprotein from transposon, putative / transcript_product=Retrovirus-related Pol polyprotein from transposon, putative / location=Cvel_scaffold1345:4850-11548(+) / protein_length=424 / sequence_SO=supercontig / SO=protein_coding / is_pseudo=false